MMVEERKNSVATFEIDDVFIITGRGLVLAGYISDGVICNGDIIEFSANSRLRQRKIIGIDEMRKLPLTDRNIGILIECANKEEMEELRNSKLSKVNAIVYGGINQLEGTIDLSEKKQKWWQKLFNRFKS